MIVKFVSRREDHQISSNLIHLLKPQDINPTDLLQRRNGHAIGKDLIRYSGWFVWGYDIENRRGKPRRDKLLLSSFCLNDERDNEEVIVIDNTSVDNSEVFTPEILRRCLFISHNADHEAQWGVATGFMPMRYGCTMVNGRRLMSGMEGYRHDLVANISRWLEHDAIPIWMDKDIRNEFEECTFFRDDHILYNASDSIRLKELYYKQLERADELGMSFLLNSLNSRIIPEIAETEVRGIKHNTEKWLGIAKDRKDKADKICQELSEKLVNQYRINLELVNPSLRKERESLEKRSSKLEERRLKLESQLRSLEEKGKTHLKSYITQKTQLEKLGLENVSTQNGQRLANQPIQGLSTLINWGSQKQVLRAFELIGMPIPQAKDKKSHQLKDGVGKEARINWFVQNENSEFLDFMTKYDSMKKLIHNVNSFGEKWVKQYVRDGRAYSLYDQAGTDSGRFSSGSKGKLKTHYNSQQIPKPREYRECFEADEGRVIITADYKNCEGIIMISQSGDMNMKRITEMSDSHSYLGTKCWRSIYLYRYNKTKDKKWLDLANTYEMNKSTPDKEKERDIFKNSGGLFPTAYGVFASKVASTSKIVEAEGQIMIDTIKAEIPLVIEYLDRVSAKTLIDGYCIHNTRTGSRRWFQKILDNKHYGWLTNKSDKIEIESAARNSVIQGTNSDLIKEAICMIGLWARLFKQDIRLLSTVHDELVLDCPESRAEFYVGKVKELMVRAAQNYLIPEISMGVEIHCKRTWTK